MAINQQAWHFKLITGEDKLHEEGYTLNLIVRRKGLRRMISTGFFAYPHQWDEDSETMVSDNRVKDLHPQRKEINDWLLEKKAEIKKVIDSFEIQKIDWTAQQFMDVFLEKLKTSSVHDYFQSWVNFYHEEKRWGSKNQFFWTCHMLGKADEKFLQRMWSDIDYKYVVAFDHYLKVKGNKGKGCKGNTRVYYLKALRKMYNEAIKDKCASETLYPFGKNKFSISALQEETPKRYIKTDDLGKIKDDETSNIFREKTRRIFMFCYYCYGMSIRDSALLKSSNILTLEKGDFIAYKRIKTQHNPKSKTIYIKINDNIKELLDWFKENTTLVGDYLLPVVSIDYPEKSLELYNHITYRNRRINGLLKGIAKELAIHMNITTHVNRHTAANRLQDMGISRDIIQQMLGHMDANTTSIYLDSFSHDVVAEAGQVL